MLRRVNRRSPRTSTSPELCESRMLLSATHPVDIEFAALDAAGNNAEQPAWGTSHQELLRLTTVDYADSLSELAGTTRPGAREVSNAIAATDGDAPNSRYLTDMLWVWGQFIDHDLDLSEGGTEYTPIDVPAGDPWFDPAGTGEAAIPFTRSLYEYDASGVRQQYNAITAFLDGSVVYGSDDERAAALRTFEDGQLKTSAGDLLPWNADGLANAGGTGDSLFLAGDVRANENVALTAMHTIWVREHNRVAAELARQQPELTDEQLYQAARAVVRAELQVITYNEYLPALLGPDAIARYDGYDANVNPNIANVFSTAAYRFGHSLLSPELARLDADGNEIDAGHLPLQSAFFRPDELVEHGIDSILRGAAFSVAQELDNQVVDDVRNFLFGPPGSGGFDLASLNIQRGRDHGLPDYNQARSDLGLEPVASFSEITSDPATAAALEDAYGSVDEIDLWVGGLAEDHLPGSSMGELFTTVLVDQFERLRDGDRFWYENQFRGRLLRDLENTTLADVIERNSDVEQLQPNVFFAPAVMHVDLSGTRTRNVTLRSKGGAIEVVDDRSGDVLQRSEAASVDRVMLVGSASGRDRFTVTSIDQEDLPGGVVAVLGTAGERDVLKLRGTRGADEILLADTSAVMNGLAVEHLGTDRIIVHAGRGNDVVDASAVTDFPVSLYGGAGGDRLRGGRGHDMLDGQGGHDRLEGRDGDDVLLGRGGNDRLIGGRGNDRLLGGAHDDELSGGSGRDDLRGGRGRNSIVLAPRTMDLVEGRNAGRVRSAFGLPKSATDLLFTTRELDRLLER